MFKRLFLLVFLFFVAATQCVFGVDFSDNESFRQELKRVRVDHKIPGMAAAIVYDGQIKNVAVSGVRKSGTTSPVQVNDAFQIGSITKPITATLAYVLDQRKILSVKTRIIDIFPELASEMRPEYLNVTIEMLLTHLAAFPYMPLTEGNDEFLLISPNLMKRRYEYVRAAIKDKPEGKVGQHYVYSGGAIIAAAMMERKTGLSWGTLVSKYVYKPLEMNSAGGGATSKLNSVTGVWEHQRINGKNVPIPAPASYSSEPHAPAGRNIHASVTDLAKFMISHFPYSNDHKSVLYRPAKLAMQTKSRFAQTSPGWFVWHGQWSDWKTIYHYGDNGKSIGALVFSPKFEAGYVILANISGDLAWEGVGEIAGKIEKFLATEIENSLDHPRLTLATRAVSYGKPVRASNVYYNSLYYDATQAFDGDYATRWATDEGVKYAWIEVDLEEPQLISTILIKEEFSPRVSSFSILGKMDEESSYTAITTGYRIGDELVLNPPPFTARFVKLIVRTGSASGPTISELQLFRERITRIY